MDKMTWDGESIAIPHPQNVPTISLWPQAGRALRLGRSATYAAAKRGEIPTIRLGRRIVVPTAGLRKLLQLSDVDTWIEARSRGDDADGPALVGITEEGGSRKADRPSVERERELLVELGDKINEAIATLDLHSAAPPARRLKS